MVPISQIQISNGKNPKSEIAFHPPTIGRQFKGAERLLFPLAKVSVHSQTTASSPVLAPNWAGKQAPDLLRPKWAQNPSNWKPGFSFPFMAKASPRNGWNFPLFPTGKTTSPSRTFGSLSYKLGIIIHNIFIKVLDIIIIHISCAYCFTVSLYMKGIGLLDATGM